MPQQSNESSATPCKHCLYECWQCGTVKHNESNATPCTYILRCSYGTNHHDICPCRIENQATIEKNEKEIARLNRVATNYLNEMHRLAAINDKLQATIKDLQERLEKQGAVIKDLKSQLEDSNGILEAVKGEAREDFNIEKEAELVIEEMSDANSGDNGFARDKSILVDFGRRCAKEERERIAGDIHAKSESLYAWLIKLPVDSEQRKELSLRCGELSNCAEGIRKSTPKENP